MFFTITDKTTYNMPVYFGVYSKDITEVLPARLEVEFLRLTMRVSGIGH